jgi:glycosyltransferase involved in cell wall biosynthesis
MTFHFYSPSHFEKWSYKNPLEQGIGGSETAHIECAIRLAKRGNTVYSYSPLPDDVTPGTSYKGVLWFDLEDADFKDRGIWVMGRAVKELDNFEVEHKGQKIWLVMQDTMYPTLDEKRAEKLDLFLPLCETHVNHTKNTFPKLSDRIIKSANGIRTDIIEEVIKLNKDIVRDPHRMMYASSPDRGLITLLKIFPRIREKISNASLHVFYGFDNIEKIVDKNIPIDSLGNTRADLEYLLDQPGVFWHGRIGQRELYIEWLKSGVWAYPTRFSETSCITSMEAQALGAIPVTNPFWALKDNVMYGSLIDGDPGLNGLTQTRYIEEIIYQMTRPFVPPLKKGYLQYRRQNSICREEMMQEALLRFDWEKVVDQYEQLAKD